MRTPENGKGEVFGIGWLGPVFELLFDHVFEIGDEFVAWCRLSRSEEIVRLQPKEHGACKHHPPRNLELKLPQSPQVFSEAMGELREIDVPRIHVLGESLEDALPTHPDKFLDRNLGYADRVHVIGLLLSSG